MNWIGLVYNIVCVQVSKAESVVGIIDPIYDYDGVFASNIVHMILPPGLDKTGYFWAIWSASPESPGERWHVLSVDNGDLNPWVWFRIPPSGAQLFIAGGTNAVGSTRLQVTIVFEHKSDEALSLEWGDALSQYTEISFNVDTGPVIENNTFIRVSETVERPNVGTDLVRISEVKVEPVGDDVVDPGEFQLNLSVVLPPWAHPMFVDP